MPITEQELARRRRVNELADNLAESLGLMLAPANEIIVELEVDFRDLVALIGQRMSKNVNDGYEKVYRAALEAFDASRPVGPDNDPTPPYRDVDKLPPDGKTDSQPHTHQSGYMFETIHRLLEEAPKLTDRFGAEVPDQTPAIQAHIILRSGPTIQGALSLCPAGGLKLMTPTELPAPTDLNPKAVKMVLAETYLDYSDVVAVAVERDIEAVPGSSIFTS